MTHVNENTAPITPPAPVCFLLAEMSDGAIIAALGRRCIGVVRGLALQLCSRKTQQIRVKWEAAGWLEVTQGVEGGCSSVSALQTHADYETRTGFTGQRSKAMQLLPARSLCVALCRVLRLWRKTFPVFKSIYLDRLHCVVVVWLGSNDTDALLLLSRKLGYIATLFPNRVKHEWQ